MKQFKQSLYDSTIAPIGGWSGFKYPTTKFKFVGDYKSIDDIIFHVKKYEEQNNLQPIANIRAFIEDYFCSRPGMESQCQPCQKIARNAGQTIRGASAFIKAKAKQVTGDEWHTNPERAGQRAAKCSACSFNIPAGMTIADKQMEGLFKKEDGFHTEHDDRLLQCRGCGGCPLKPKVWFPPDIIKDSLKGQTFENLNKLIVTNQENPSNRSQTTCWMMEEKYMSAVLELHNQGLTPEVISDRIEGVSIPIIKYWIKKHGNR